MDAQKNTYRDKGSIVASLGIVLIISRGSSMGEFNAPIPSSEKCYNTSDAGGRCSSSAQEYERLKLE